jgi:hypothetical protein
VAPVTIGFSVIDTEITSIPARRSASIVAVASTSSTPSARKIYDFCAYMFDDIKASIPHAIVLIILFML